MNNDILNQYSKYLAVTILYPKEDCIAFSIVTKNPNFLKNPYKYNFYDFFLKKEIKFKTENIVDFHFKFTEHVDTKKIHYNNLDLSDKLLKNHFDRTQAYIECFFKSKSREFRKITKYINKNEFSEIVDYCREELYFYPQSTNKKEICKEMKKRKAFLMQTIDGGHISKLVSIFDIKDEDLISKDKKIVKKCKEKWKDVILLYCNKAKKQLAAEIKESENDTDLIIEVQEISKMLDQTIQEFEKKEFSTPKEIASFWPELLRPDPNYVIKR
jgi:hypothetical protein